MAGQNSALSRTSPVERTPHGLATLGCRRDASVLRPTHACNAQALEQAPVLKGLHTIHRLPDELRGTAVRKAFDETVKARSFVRPKGKTATNRGSTHRC